jgi:hypothetical protein
VRDETKDKASLTVRRYPKMASQSWQETAHSGT